MTRGAVTSAEPLVSIILCTYNQEKFVRQAIRSIIAQEGNIPFELIIADDFSQDRTLDIIRFETSALANVEFLPSTRNLGIAGNYQRAFAVCRGEYVSVLEGDDHWSSPTKLKDQVELLRNNGELSIAISQTCVMFEDKGRYGTHPKVDPSHNFQKFSVEDLIAGNFTNFSGTTYRNSLLKKLPEEYFALQAYDWLLNIWMAQHGPIGCVNATQVVYRVHKDGLWSGLDEEKKLRAQLDVLDDYDRFLNFRFTTEFKALESRLKSRLREVTSGSKVSHEPVYKPEPIALGPTGRGMLPTLGRVLWTMHELTPPILKWPIKVLVPPALKRLIVRAIASSRISHASR